MYVVAVYISNMVDVQLKKKRGHYNNNQAHTTLIKKKGMSLNKPTTSYKLFTKARKSSMNSPIVKRVTKVAPIGPLGKVSSMSVLESRYRLPVPEPTWGRVHRGAI